MSWIVWDREWWRPKPGPVVTRGRLQHLTFAWALTVTGGAFGYAGLGLALGLVVIFWLWEALTPVIWRRAWHPWGDVIDFLAFEVGQLLGAVVVLIGRNVTGGP